MQLLRRLFSADSNGTVTKVERCVICRKEIKQMIYKGSGVCGDNHRKIRDGDDPQMGRC